MTEAIYLEVSEKTEAAKKAGRRVSVSGMLKLLGVSRSGYQAWLHHIPSNTEKRREAVKSKIKDIYENSRQNYGAPKITVELRKTGEVISERTVGTYMHQMGIRAQWSKPWTITTKDSDFSTELQNILDEQFNPDRPNAVWCSDITYIWTIDGFVYLTSIMDLFSRKIIAWTLSETLEVSCVIDTINKAKARRNIDQPLIIHSDRGSQYVAKEYIKATEHMKRSYSKKAFPWDNACIESFHSIIKREWLNRFKIRDHKQAYRLIFEYLEAFYNTKRIHSHCDYMSPDEFERVYERTHTEAVQVCIRVRLHHHGIRANGFDALPRDHKVIVASQQPQAAAATMQHHSGKAGRFFLKLNIIDAAQVFAIGKAYHILPGQVTQRHGPLPLWCAIFRRFIVCVRKRLIGNILRF